MENSKSNSFMNWLKNPSSWTSLIATFIAVVTFYQVNFSIGSLNIQLPEQVGVKLNSNSNVDLLVPLVLYNTGSSSSQRIVTAITATIIDNRNQTFDFRWQDTWDFMGKIEFESRFPAFKDKEPKLVDDYIIYKSRSVPFVVPGEESDYRMVRLVPLKPDATMSQLSAFKLTLVVKTSDGIFEGEGSYSGGELHQTNYVWFQKSER